MNPATFIDEQIEEAAEARRLVLGRDPLDFSAVPPLDALPHDASLDTELLVLRTCEVPRDGDLVRFEVGVWFVIRHYGVALVNRWIGTYGMRVAIYPLQPSAIVAEPPPEGGPNDDTPKDAFATSSPADRAISRSRSRRAEGVVRGKRGRRSTTDNQRAKRPRRNAAEE